MCLIDTNIIIYYLGGDKNAIEFIQSHRGQLSVSVISVIEVLSFRFPNEASELLAKKFLAENFVWLSIDKSIIETTANIRKIKKMKTPDAIIAATAICHKIPLVTRNSKDFSHLNITLINPID